MLALALADVSGLAITSPEDARAVVSKIPKTLRSRIWIVYRGNLPEDRYFSSADLYIAPEFQMFNRQLIDAGGWDDCAEARLTPQSSPPLHRLRVWLANTRN